MKLTTISFTIKLISTNYLIELKRGGIWTQKRSGLKRRLFWIGDGNEWRQSRVLQFFSMEELLIGREFWNFITKRGDGYQIVLDEYSRNGKVIKSALDEIKREYLG
jgi:hypothetical protein